MKKTISIIACASAICLAASGFGCGEEARVTSAVRYADGMYYTESKTRSYSEPASVTFGMLGDDVMPIGGFYGPYSAGGSMDGNDYPDYLSDRVFGQLQDCGLNTIVYTIDRWSTGGTNDKLVKGLELGEKYGIGYFIDTYAVMERIGSHTQDVDLTGETWDWLEGLIREISDNGNRKSFFGLHDQDEPFTKQLDNLHEFRKAFYSLDVVKEWGIHTCTDVLGYWNGENNLYNTDESVTYDEYMERYMATETPKFLSATQYPYTSAETSSYDVANKLYSLLSIYRKYSRQYDVPLWRMMQAGGQWNDNADWTDTVDPYPSEGELLVDVNMSLAYGAKGIQYFPAIQPIYFAQETGGTYDFANRNGLIGADGNLTRWYFYAKRANEQIRAIDHVLMHADNEKILVHGEDAQKSVFEYAQFSYGAEKAENGYYELKSVSGDDCVIGCFNYYGKTALYVVNFSPKEKADLSLTFDGNDYLYEITQRAVSQKAVGGRVSLRLDAGEGALIVLN